MEVARLRIKRHIILDKEANLESAPLCFHRPQTNGRPFRDGRRQMGLGATKALYIYPD
jgi:hypothetical protein